MKKFDEAYTQVLHELRTVDNSHVLKDLKQTLNGLMELKVPTGEDIKDYVKYLKKDLKEVKEALNHWAKGGGASSYTNDFASAVSELESASEDLDDDVDFDDKDIIKNLEKAYKDLEQKLKKSHAM